MGRGEEMFCDCSRFGFGVNGGGGSYGEISETSHMKRPLGPLHMSPVSEISPYL